MENISCSKLKISTCTFIANLSSILDLEIIFKNIDIDDEILGIKYNNRSRGSMKTPGTFFNQMTARVFIKDIDKEINLKAFSNGKFQITGVKNTEQVSVCIKLFLKKIVKIEGVCLEKVKIVDYIINDEKDYNNIYDKNGKNIQKYDRFNSIKIYGYDKKLKEYYNLGFKKGNDKYVIDKKTVQYFKENKWFVDITHKNFIKNIYDLDGNHIGHYKYTMNYKRKNLVLQGCIFYQKDKNTRVIHNKYNFEIGEEHLVLKQDYQQELAKRNEDINENLNLIELKYTAIKNKEISDKIKNDSLFDKGFNDNIKIETSNINSNFKMDIKEGCILDKINIHNILTSEYNMLSYYKPDSKYQAINIAVYFDSDLNIVKVSNSYCYKFTVTIFQNGKIMISGCTNKKQIVTVKNMVISIFSENINNFIVKKFISEKKPKEDKNTLTIWDIL